MTELERLYAEYEATVIEGEAVRAALYGAPITDDTMLAIEAILFEIVNKAWVAWYHAMRAEERKVRP